MALMASTIGTLIAVPLSFLAARNLMETLRDHWQHYGHHHCHSYWQPGWPAW
jgi:ABC-type phosphate/phosphonate transport system permease subunit